MAAIVVELIHPIRREAVQSWTFDTSQTCIRIGRSRRNDITLFSGVVSREHAMLKSDGRTWTLQSLGTNGCYRSDRLVKNPVVSDGDVFRIARTGPRLRIRVEATAPVAGSNGPRQRPHSAAPSTPPRSRLSQEEIVTARETWMASEDTSHASLRQLRASIRKEANARKDSVR